MIKKFTLNKNIFFILIPLIFTLIYYRFEVIYGFNPTDEGRNFALINRVLNFDISQRFYFYTSSDPLSAFLSRIYPVSQYSNFKNAEYVIHVFL